MPHTLRRVALLSVLAGGAATVGPVAAAQASDATLRATVKSDVPRITRSQAKILDGLAALEKSGSPKALVTAIKAQDRDLTSLKTKLRGETSSSSTGGRARTDIIKGLALIIRANSDLLAKDLAQTSSGKHISKAQAASISATTERGNVDLTTGAKLLKV